MDAEEADEWRRRIGAWLFRDLVGPSVPEYGQAVAAVGSSDTELRDFFKLAASIASRQLA